MNNISAAEQADRLNKCLKAGLTILYKNNNFPTHPWQQWVVQAEPRMIDSRQFLVLRPGETVDSFAIEG